MFSRYIQRSFNDNAITNNGAPAPVFSTCSTLILLHRYCLFSYISHRLTIPSLIILDTMTRTQWLLNTILSYSNVLNKNRTPEIRARFDNDTTSNCRFINRNMPWVFYSYMKTFSIPRAWCERVTSFPRQQLEELLRFKAFEQTQAFSPTEYALVFLTREFLTGSDDEYGERTMGSKSCTENDTNQTYNQHALIHFTTRLHTQVGDPKWLKEAVLLWDKRLATGRVFVWQQESG